MIDSQNQYPINLFLLIQQNSGERISSISRYFLKPLLEWEREQNERALDTEQEFIQLRLIYEDSTHESLIVDLAAGRKSAALWSDEAALILGGTSMRENAAMGYLAVLNKAFHGDKIVHRRKQAESAELDGYRLSSCLMMQQKILTHLLNLGAKSGVGLAEGTGFLTRFLFAEPKSIIGARKYQQAPKTLPYMDEFKRRMEHHLNKPVPQDWNSIRTIKLNSDATILWVEEFNRIEKMSAPGSELQDYEGLTSKHGEHIARIAGMFCAFEEKDDQITEPVMSATIKLAQWHFHEAKRVTGSGIKNKELRNAIELKDWLINHFINNVSDHVTASRIVGYGPGSIRNAKDRDEALAILVKHGYVRTREEFRSVLIKLNPRLIPSVANANLANLG